MATTIQLPDRPVGYPATPGTNTTTAIGTAVTLIAAFKNVSSVATLKAILKTMHYLAYSPSADTTFQFELVGNPTVTGGTWTAIPGSGLQINTTATISGGVSAMTTFGFAATAQGNQPQTISLSILEAEDAGLTLTIGQEFAIVANTHVALSTLEIMWSAHWVEID